MRKFTLTVLITALFIYFLPNLLSTSWGKERLKQYLQAGLGGEVNIESLQLSWHNKQICKGVYWERSGKKIECFAEEIICEAPLLDCLFYKSTSLDLLLNGGTISSPKKIKIGRKEKECLIRFTPVRAKVANGKIHFEHTQLHLNEKLQLNMKGSVNLINNHLDVQLGIPSSSLKKMFKLRELPEGYVLEVPLSCKLSAKSLEKNLIKIFIKNYAKVILSQR